MQEFSSQCDEKVEIASVSSCRGQLELWPMGWDLGEAQGGGEVRQGGGGKM